MFGTRLKARYRVCILHSFVLLCGGCGGGEILLCLETMAGMWMWLLGGFLMSIQSDSGDNASCPGWWKAPPLGSFKLNTDGAYSPSKSLMGMGGAIRDASGAWVRGFMASCSGGDPLKAELTALQSGLILLWEMNIRDAICEVDCLEIVDVLRDSRIDFHELASDFREIHLLLQRDWHVQLRHVPRTTDDVVDCLAGLGADLQCSLAILEDPPPQLLPFLARNLLAL